MSTDICLPRVSPDDAAVTLVKWHVGVGSSVKPGDVIAEIESDKAVVGVLNVHRPNECQVGKRLLELVRVVG